MILRTCYHTIGLVDSISLGRIKPTRANTEYSIPCTKRYAGAIDFVVATAYFMGGTFKMRNVEDKEVLPIGWLQIAAQ